MGMTLADDAKRVGMRASPLQPQKNNKMTRVTRGILYLAVMGKGFSRLPVRLSNHQYQRAHAKKHRARALDSFLPSFA